MAEVATQAAETPAFNATLEMVEGESSEASEVSPEQLAAEKEATRHGWVGKDEWIAQGKPEDRWNDAASFLDVRVHTNKLDREENQKLRAKMAALEAKDRARDQAEAEARARLSNDTLRMQLRQAREDGDEEKADELRIEIAKVKFAEEQAKAKPAAAEIQPEVREAFVAFADRNPWFKSDATLQRAMGRELTILRFAGMSEGPAKDLENALDVVKRMHPEKFRGSVRRPSMVETGGETGASVGVRTWDNLKPEIRAQGEKVLKEYRVSKEDFLANCDKDHFR